jgi:type VI secretion system protein ImpJ
LSTNLTDLPDIIEWHEGMLLTPQHFQQFAERSELLTQLMHSRVGGFAWGVLNLKIDEAALAEGVVRVLDLEAILPDGLLVAVHSDRGVNLEFDLRKTETNPTRIHLVVPREAAIYERSDYSRYESVVGREDPVTDGISGAERASIPRVRPKMRLAAGQSVTAGVTALPLIEFSKEGSYCTATGYIPPTPQMKDGAPLADLCAPVCKLVRDKATSLAMKLASNARSSDLAGLHQFQCLVAGLPAVEATLRSNGTHPHSLYLALCSMAGSVAFLSSARVPPVFSPYDHTNLRASFEQVLDFICRALAEGLIDNWTSKEFKLVRRPSERRGAGDKPTEEVFFELFPNPREAFGDDADFSAPYMGLMLRAPAGAKLEPLVEWGQTCLLASFDFIRDLEMSRSRGAVCEWVDSLEELVPPVGSMLFRVTNDAAWLDPRKRLILKAAKQETRMPASATLFVRQRRERHGEA